MDPDKTTSVQELAALVRQKELVVQNPSLSTDDSDLLGGYRPVTPRQLFLPVYLYLTQPSCSFSFYDILYTHPVCPPPHRITRSSVPSTMALLAEQLHPVRTLRSLAIENINL